MNVFVVRADITTLALDAIVNAANPWLTPGGGVDGAIHRAAGPALAEACKELRGCQVGSAKITPGFALSCRLVIHAVGPDCRVVEDMEEATVLLRATYTAVMNLAWKNKVSTLAIPAISTGLYQFPVAKACRVAVGAVKEFGGDLPEDVYFVAFTEDVERAYIKALEEY